MELVERFDKVVADQDARASVARKQNLIQERHRVAVQLILFALEEEHDGRELPDEVRAERLLRRVLMAAGTEISDGS